MNTNKRILAGDGLQDDFCFAPPVYVAVKPKDNKSLKKIQNKNFKVAGNHATDVPAPAFPTSGPGNPEKRAKMDLMASVDEDPAKELTGITNELITKTSTLLNEWGALLRKGAEFEQTSLDKLIQLIATALKQEKILQDQKMQMLGKLHNLSTFLQHPSKEA